MYYLLMVSSDSTVRTVINYFSYKLEDDMPSAVQSYIYTEKWPTISRINFVHSWIIIYVKCSNPI